MIKYSKYLIALAISMFLYSCDEDLLTPNTDIKIDSLSAMVAPVGHELTIRGGDFGLKSDSSKIFFNNIEILSTDESQVPAWSYSAIRVYVPANATSGKIKVMVGGKSTNEFDFYVGHLKPAAVTGLAATSGSANSVILTWEPSTSASVAGAFDGYELRISGADSGPLAPVKISAGTQMPYTVSDLTEGQVYTFTVVSMYKNGVTSEANPEVNWSPASRFNLTANDVVIRLYGSKSSGSSGLDLYDEVEGGPMALKVSSGSNWNLGLFTNNGKTEFGSASLLSYNFNGTPVECQISSVSYDGYNSLEEIFDNVALNLGTFAPRVINLEDYEAGESQAFVMVVRTKEGSNADYNYAKVLVKKINGKFLQGSGDEVYIECVISYQKAPGVPYAGVNQTGKKASN